VSLKIIAFYLPQYHPIPENDLWWGKGFTDWENVKKCTPRFKNHYQPHEPGELGYYDLRNPAAREAQANLAKTFGINAFCYYHYWFNGKRLLHQPLDEVLASGRPDFPFCLCWANENWTRAWDGQARNLLIGQNYSEADHRQHLQWLIPAFRDPRYLTIAGKPLFIMYRTDHIPKLEQTVQLWKNAVREAGLPGIYLCAMRSNFPQLTGAELTRLGFDAVVDFQPNRNEFPTPGFFKRLPKALIRRFLGCTSLFLKQTLPAFYRYSTRVIPYEDLAALASKKIWSFDYKLYPCVFPSWDNSARRRIANVVQNLAPSSYGRWLSQTALQTIRRFKDEERLVFINAWNEWAEGCHLEPDKRFGRAFLQETLRVCQEIRSVEENLAT
jgi:lipopolysaccharide biosynthesis protein